MKLLLKFNLIFLSVFLLGLIAASLIARVMLQQSAKQEVADRARLLMEKAQAVSSYTAEQIKPLLETQMKYTFLPQSVPSYAAAEVLAKLQKTYPEYSFKSAMLNPTNPRDRATAWEEDLVHHFHEAPDQREFIGERDTPTGRALFIARPIVITDAGCLTCHTSPEIAPKPMVDKYGPANGFSWKLNEVLGVQVVSVPMAVPLQTAERQLWVVIGVLTGVFVLIGAALNLTLWKLVIQPVTRLSGIADKVSLGEDAPAFELRSGDEIGTLSESFGRMRTSLAHAMQMLDA
jgi:protein-histidine pros-kinase